MMYSLGLRRHCTDREARLGVVCAVGMALASWVTFVAFVTDMLVLAAITCFACMKGPAGSFGKKELALPCRLWLKTL